MKESMNHLFLNCNFYMNVWSFILMCASIWNCHSCCTIWWQPSFSKVFFCETFYVFWL